MEQPQEIEVWYVLPAIRKNLALELKKLGLSQKDVATKLGITPAAVSYYIQSKRASKKELELGEEFKQNIAKSAKDIFQNKTTVLQALQTNLKLFRESKMLCKLHKDLTKVNCDCTICCG